MRRKCLVFLKPKCQLILVNIQKPREEKKLEEVFLKSR